MIHRVLLLRHGPISLMNEKAYYKSDPSFTAWEAWLSGVGYEVIPPLFEGGLPLLVSRQDHLDCPLPHSRRRPSQPP